MTNVRCLAALPTVYTVECEYAGDPTWFSMLCTWLSRLKTLAGSVTLQKTGRTTSLHHYITTSSLHPLAVSDFKQVSNEGLAREPGGVNFQLSTFIFFFLQFDSHTALLSTEHRANVTQRQVVCYASFEGSLSELDFRIRPAPGTGLRSQACGELNCLKHS